MKYTLSEACTHTEETPKVMRDCGYEALYLVGKPFPEGKTVVSYLASPKYIPSFLGHEIAGVICTEEVAKELEGAFKGGVAVCADPKKAFFQIHNHYASEDTSRGPVMIDGTARIHESAVIDDHDVVIGANTEILPHAVISAGTVIGRDCVIGAGTVIGGSSFYYYGSGSEKRHVISTGRVEIGDNVDIHGNVVVQKGALGGTTRIGANTKISYNTLVSHDVQIGENVTVAGGTSLAGGVQIGSDSFVGLGVRVAPSVKCGKGVKLSIGAVVTKDVPDGAQVSGNFAVEHSKYLKHIKEISG